MTSCYFHPKFQYYFPALACTSNSCHIGTTGWLPCWLDSGKVNIEWEWGFCPWCPVSLLLCAADFVGTGAGRWQNFPVAFNGHQHWSLPMHLPPFRQGIWQKTAGRGATWLTEARDSLSNVKIFGASRSIMWIYASVCTRMCVIRNRRSSTNRSGLCRVSCGLALFANSKGHVVLSSGTPHPTWGRVTALPFHFGPPSMACSAAFHSLSVLLGS